MLDVKNIFASYKKLQVLKGISMQVKEGDLIAIIGPNGSGKSTVLKCISGILRTDEGSIELFGKEISKKKTSEIISCGISYVMQNGRVFKTLSVDENLEMGGYLLENEGIIQARKEEVYSIFPELKEKKDQRATFLSGGQQQMLALGRALMTKPSLLLLDEPSAGLSPHLVNEISKIIRRVHGQGTTIILVEQNVALALEIANKVYLLGNGKVAIEGSPNKLKSESLISQYYFGNGKENR